MTKIGATFTGAGGTFYVRQFLEEHFQTGRFNHQQNGAGRATNVAEAVWSIAGDEDEVAWDYLEAMVADAEQVAEFEDVKAFVLAMVHVQCRASARRTRLSPDSGVGGFYRN